MPKAFFTESEIETITHAVDKAEKNTTGEIVTAFIRQSYDYAIYELLYAVIIGLIYFTVASLFLPSVQSIISNLLWTDTEVMYYTLVFYGFSTFFVIALFYFLFNLPFFDRLIVPKNVREKKVLLLS